MSKALGQLVDNGLCGSALDLIADEDARQLEEWGSQEHSIYKWLTILSEEVGELSKAVLESLGDDVSLDDISKEAVQVATLALKIAWMVKFEELGG